MDHISRMSALHKEDLEHRPKKIHAHQSDRTIKKSGPFSATAPFEHPPEGHKEQHIDEPIAKTKRYKQYQPDWYPWEAVEKLFVQGAPDKTGAMHYPTIGELADHFSISYRAIRVKMTDEHWIKKRTEWQHLRQHAVQELSKENLYATALRFDQRCIEMAELAIQEIIAYFLEAKANQDTISKLDLDRLGRSAVNWQRVGRLALGMSTENQAAKLETTNHSIQSLDLSRMTEEELALLEKLATAVETRSLPPNNVTL